MREKDTSNIAMNNKHQLAAEFTALYIGVPVLFYFDLVPLQKIVALLLVTMLCVLVLWFDRRHDFGRLFTMPDDADGPVLKELALKGTAVALGVYILAFRFHPDGLFAFPSREPVIWMVVMLLYPLLSALPQELIYRAFFFERYEPLFRNEQVLGYASAVAFAFLHIVYDNGWALALSLLGGLLFAHTYRRTRSLFWVSVEHALYGCIIFTVGLGRYFYEPF